MKNNKLLLKLLSIISIFCLHLSMKAQFTDTITKVRDDKELITWVEDYIIKTGYIKKTKQGFEYGNKYTPTLIGRYSFFIIEAQQYDTISVILYRLRAGPDFNHPIIIKRIITKNKKSEFIAIGRNPDLESAFQLYLLFQEFNKFTTRTQLYCYEMLFQNHERKLSKVEE